MENITNLAKEREEEERNKRIVDGEECPHCARKWIRYRIKSKEWVCISCGETWRDTRND